MLQEDCESLKQENAILKARAKRPIYDPSEHLETIEDLQGKLDKASVKSAGLRAEAEELRG